MKRILVTGAAGQLGRHVVAQLLESGYNVKALIMPGEIMDERLKSECFGIIEGNLIEYEVAENAVEGVDAVIHTANLVSPLRGMSDSEFFSNNVLSTYNIAMACGKRADKISRLVHVSSSAVYPNDSHIIATCYNPVDELHPKRPVGTYAISKLVGEEIVTSIARGTKLRFSILRPSGICSGDAILHRWTVKFVCTILRIGQQHPESALFMPDGTELWQEIESKAPPDALCAIYDLEGRPWLQQPVDVRDVAHGCICALESEAAIGEAFNISAPRAIPFDEAARIISEITGKPIVEWRVPVRWVFDLDNTKAKAMIGYRPKFDIEQMVKSAIQGTLP
ncbi:MAG: NAD(P)-dependent oxidoreductase [Armatimonadota bacterium]|nr:NAD(P)-dependent oxidoreductase [Armatimonadota bacterium]MCX7778085.1 NAD(P)-dependent oxidoreductase [Armatimonadota bacterium]MDW8025473.1 NAD(P)-dependent oxidoreductase [Armatimonadota bacterium]